MNSVYHHEDDMKSGGSKVPGTKDIPEQVLGPHQLDELSEVPQEEKAWATLPALGLEMC